MLTSEKTEIKMGEEALKEVKKNGKISNDDKMSSAVKRVGGNIAKATGKQDYNWEFIVLESKDANAFCLPGGKVVVFTGLFSYTHSDGELATVLGHEIGHALARHSGEQISHTYLESAGGYAISAVLSITGAPAGLGSIYGVATGLGIDLPYSRTQEYEADHIGIIIMAKAGYDPKTAIIFWNNFSKESNYGPVKEFFTTHPMGEKRLEELKKLLPEAEKTYAEIPVKLGIGEKL
jgi:predicted Zn-dependent protease